MEADVLQFLWERLRSSSDTDSPHVCPIWALLLCVTAWVQSSPTGVFSPCVSTVIVSVLQVETVHQLKEVQECDLEDIRMRREDIQKLRKNIKKEFPHSAFGKLKKVV